MAYIVMAYIVMAVHTVLNDMCVDACIDVGIDVWTDVCLDVCLDVCINVFIDTQSIFLCRAQEQSATCTYKRMGMRIDMEMDVHIDYVDMSKRPQTNMEIKKIVPTFYTPFAFRFGDVLPWG